MCRISLLYTHRTKTKIRSVLGKWLRGFFLLFNPCLLTESPYHAWLIQVKPFNLLSRFISWLWILFYPIYTIHNSYCYIETQLKNSYPDLKINSNPSKNPPSHFTIATAITVSKANPWFNTKIREFLPLPPLAQQRGANSTRLCFPQFRQQLSLRPPSTSALTLLPARGWIFSRAPPPPLLWFRPRKVVLSFRLFAPFNSCNHTDHLTVRHAF